MKKIIFTVLLISTMVFSISIFAQTAAKDIVIQSVSGTVGYEVSAGKWEPVTIDKKLSPSTVINTGLNSSLVLKIDGRLVTIKAMQKGPIERLAGSVVPGMAGIKIGASVTDSSVNANSAQGRSNISTASTRASDAVEDVEWAEDKPKKE